MSRAKVVTVIDPTGRRHSVPSANADGLQQIFDAIGNDPDRAAYMLLAMRVVMGMPKKHQRDVDARSSALLGEVMLFMPWMQDLALAGCESWRAA